MRNIVVKFPENFDLPLPSRVIEKSVHFYELQRVVHEKHRKTLNT